MSFHQNNKINIFERINQNPEHHKIIFKISRIHSKVIQHIKTQKTLIHLRVIKQSTESKPGMTQMLGLIESHYYNYAQGSKRKYAHNE